MAFKPLPHTPHHTRMFEQDGEHLTQTWLKWLHDLQSLIRKVDTYRPTLTATSVAAGTTNEQTFTVSGLATDDAVFVNKSSHQAGLSIGNVRVSAANTLAVQFVNTATSAITPTSEAYTIGTVRHGS